MICPGWKCDVSLETARIEMNQISVRYGFIRTRQLEGTYPGDVKQGIWGISANRVYFGWGMLDENERPNCNVVATDFLDQELPGLLAVTGLRVSEALALDREDVDLQQGIMQIRRTIFGTSRSVMVHETTRQVLANYASRRDRVVHRPATSAFFLSEQGERVKGGAARYNFAKVSRQLGLRGDDKLPPRPRSDAARHAPSICGPYPARVVSGRYRC
jgi:Phage integrase family